MNLTQLQYVKAVAATGSFSKAAELCFVTQPSLSNAIAQIEFELGGKIFLRTTRKVGLTPFGESLLPLIENVIEAKDILENSAKSYLNPVHKIIRIGASPLVDSHLLKTAIEPFQRQNPEVEIVFKECFLDDMEKRLNNFQIDVVLAPAGFKCVSQRKCFFYEDTLYYLSQDSPDAAAPVSLSAVASQTFVVTPDVCGLTRTIENLFDQKGLIFQKYAGQALSYQVLEDWAEWGIGATILPKSKISSQKKTAVKLFIDENTPAKISFEMSWNAAAARPQHLKKFIEYFRKTVPSIVNGLANQSIERESSEI